MKSLERNYDKIFNFFLYVIGSTIIFRQFNTYLILAFVLFNVVFYKKLKFSKRSIILCLIIASPFLLDVLFFWNNESYYLGVKASEKRASLLFIPLIILGYRHKINFNKLLIVYAVSTVSILFCLFIRYIIVYPEFVSKYLKGIHLWEMGYNFAKSFGTHAPALNMHVAFVAIICFYLLVNKVLKKSYGVFLLTLSFLFLLYINTRVALVIAIIGFFVVLFYRFTRNRNKLKLIKVSIILTFSLAAFIAIFINFFPYTLDKYTKGSFGDMDMVGRLDEFENPEAQVFSKLVTRVSIWKAVVELSSERLWVGHSASNARKKLVNYYRDTNQKFLEKYEFPPHNQFLDFLLKFGVLGLVIVITYIFTIGYIGVNLKNAIVVSFFLLFFMSNLTDDFLNRYDGIVFSAFWFSVFGNLFIKKEGFEKN